MIAFEIPPPRHGDERRRRWLLVGAYLAMFLVFDWMSYIRPFQGLNITPWNPQPALAVTFLLFSPRSLPLVWLGLVAAEVLVRGLPADWLTVVAATGALSCSFAAIARVLAARLGRVPALATTRDLLVFCVIAVGGALANGLCYVSAFAAGGRGPDGPLFEAVLRYWVGDAVGMIVTLPMLWALLDRTRRAELLVALKDRHWLVVVPLIALALWVVFGREGSDHFKYFYVLMPPVVWAAARGGLSGAMFAAALTQGGLLVAVQWRLNQDLTVFELQALMAALTMTGLLIGVAVDERQRAAAQLRGSLRMAAAGQMSAALAHELSQPLTALGTYGVAARAIADGPLALPPDERMARMAEVARRMADDALRAGTIVRQLREFFHAGGADLAPASPNELVAEALAAHARRAEVLQVALETDLDAALAPVRVDRVQIAVVLRNLLANAIDAVASRPGPRRVVLRAHDEGEHLRVDVVDNGPGIDAARVASLFDPGLSDKPGGMGIGLSLCRAIVEAHGGRLWVQPASGGHLCFTLPRDRNDEGEGRA